MDINKKHYDLTEKHDVIEYIRSITPFAITPVRKAKTRWIHPFTSKNAFVQVTDAIGEKLYDKLNPGVKDPEAFKEMEQKHFNGKQS